MNYTQMNLKKKNDCNHVKQIKIILIKDIFFKYKYQKT